MSRGWDVLLLSAGGALGVNARYGLATWMTGRGVTSRYPWSTFAINVSGSLAIGLVATILARWPASQAHPARLFLVVGFLGGYTTFSTFAIEGQSLWQRREVAASLAYLAGSVAAGFVAVVLGIAIGRGIVGPTEEAGEPVASGVEE